MYRVAVVEDEELIRTMLKLNLERVGYEVEAMRTAREFLSRMGETRYDLALLDIVLPDLGGDSILERMRAAGILTPVLMVTARGDVETKVKVLEKGADDHLSKPFDMKELLARVAALIRRSQGERVLPSHGVISVGRFRVNLETRSAIAPDTEAVLTEKERDLLACFARNQGRVLSRPDLLEEVWGMDVDPTPRTVDNFVLRLRRVFEEDPEEPRHFLTVRSMGYRFEG